MNESFELPDSAQIQALVRSAFGALPHGRFLLLRIEKPALVRAWIGSLLGAGLVRRADEVVSRAHGGSCIDEAVVLAFSYVGLTRLGLKESGQYPFPSAFRGGMASPRRAPLLGDRDRSSWLWGDVARDASDEASSFQVDLLLAHYRAQPFAAGVLPLLQPEALAPHGLVLVRQIDTCTYYLKARKEPFGFTDGIAQPQICWTAEDRRKAEASGRNPNHETVASGEFILGDINAYGERSYVPDVVGWSGSGGEHFARHGSYLAVRQIEQHVERFRRYEASEEARRLAEPGGVSVTEKMIGRRKDGQPLVARPGAPACPASSKAPDNDFLFRVGDAEGFQCPRGAHIRRANPRDALGWDVESGVIASKLHRLLRRGRVYRSEAGCGDPSTSTCGDDGQGTDCGKGLFFIALNTDLDRQFEFVQQRWIASPKFADLWNEADPALGSGTQRAFSIPASGPVGERAIGLPQFTTVRGGGYFFLPGMSALEFIASGGSAQPPAGDDGR